MNVFNLKEMQVFPYEERGKNVFFKADEFKTQLIELAEKRIEPLLKQTKVAFNDTKIEEELQTANKVDML